MGQYCNTAAAPELGCYDNTLKRFHLSVSHQVRDCEIDIHFHFTSIIAFPVVQCKINAEQQMTGARQVPVTATTAAEEADCQGSSNCGELILNIFSVNRTSLSRYVFIEIIYVLYRTDLYSARNFRFYGHV